MAVSAAHGGVRKDRSFSEDWLMGTHGASLRPRALPPARRAGKSTNVDSNEKRRRRLDLSLTDWPVARRLFTVIVAALLMGLIFGGLRVADAENSANQFSRTLQLAKLSAQLIGISQDLQNEEDATDVALISGTTGDLPALQTKTNNDLVAVRASLQQVVGGGFPAAVVSDANAVKNALSSANIGPVLSQGSTGGIGTTLHALFNTQAANGAAVL
ncbi:MAG: hypothetical protein ACRDNS_24785, partial [Trebonia sp.]